MCSTHWAIPVESSCRVILLSMREALLNLVPNVVLGSVIIAETRRQEVQC